MLVYNFYLFVFKEKAPPISERHYGILVIATEAFNS
jgi:hypothetical protein